MEVVIFIFACLGPISLSSHNDVSNGKLSSSCSPLMWPTMGRNLSFPHPLASAHNRDPLIQHNPFPWSQCSF